MNNEIVLLRRIEELEKLIQRQPEVGGVWQNWTPKVTAEGSMTISNLVVEVARYCLIGDSMGLELSIKFTTSGTASNQVNISYPFSIITSSYRSFYTGYRDSGDHPGWCYGPRSTTFGVRHYDGSNWSLAENLRIQANGFIKYR